MLMIGARLAGKSTEAKRRHRNEAARGTGPHGGEKLTLGTVCIFAEGSSFYSARKQRATMCAMGKGTKGELLSHECKELCILSSLS